VDRVKKKAKTLKYLTSEEEGKRKGRRVGIRLSNVAAKAPSFGHAWGGGEERLAGSTEKKGGAGSRRPCTQILASKEMRKVFSAALLGDLSTYLGGVQEEKRDGKII